MQVVESSVLVRSKLNNKYPDRPGTEYGPCKSVKTVVFGFRLCLSSNQPLGLEQRISRLAERSWLSRLRRKRGCSSDRWSLCLGKDQRIFWGLSLKARAHSSAHSKKVCLRILPRLKFCKSLRSQKLPKSRSKKINTLSTQLGLKLKNYVHVMIQKNNQVVKVWQKKKLEENILMDIHAQLANCNEILNWNFYKHNFRSAATSLVPGKAGSMRMAASMKFLVTLFPSLASVVASFWFASSLSTVELRWT